MSAGSVAPAVSAVVVAGPAVVADARAHARPALEALAADSGGVVVATCQRVEAYLPSAEPRLPDGLPAGMRVVRGVDAARHLLAVAIGLESTVLAEDQVLHQVRASVAAARSRGPLPPDLEAMFEGALRAGRRARSWRPGRPRSLADLAVERIERCHGSLAGRTVLVVGTGEMGRLASRAAARRGAAVAVASRSPERARVVADPIGADVWPIDAGSRIGAVAGVVVALGGSWPAGAETLGALEQVPLVVDLSMPRALSAEVAERLGSRLVDVDAIASTGEPLEGRRADEIYRRRLTGLLEAALNEYLDRMAARDAAAVARAIAARVERERVAELDALWRRLPGLDPDDRAAIDGMSRHLAERLFRDPLERLGRDPDGRRERAARELFGL